MTLKDKKAIKKILRIAKKHPDLYSKAEVMYAKIIKKRLKKNESHFSASDSEAWRKYGVYRQSF